MKGAGVGGVGDGWFSRFAHQFKLIFHSVRCKIFPAAVVRARFHFFLSANQVWKSGWRFRSQFVVGVIFLREIVTHFGGCVSLFFVLRCGCEKCSVHLSCRRRSFRKSFAKSKVSTYTHWEGTFGAAEENRGKYRSWRGVKEVVKNWAVRWRRAPRALCWGWCRWMH